MSLAEIERAALDLPEPERVALITSLIASVPASIPGISDEEIEQRSKELATGEVAEMDHDEFVAEIRKNRAA